MNRRLTWSGWIVLSVGSFHHSEKNQEISEQIIARKVKLDALHKEKIALARAIVVINVNDYYGESTRSEIAHADKLGIPVYWFGKPVHFDRGWERSWLELLDESPDDLKPVEPNSA